VKPPDGYVLQKYSLIGTVIGAAISIPLLIFGHSKDPVELVFVLTTAGYAVGWFHGFIKLGGES